MIVIFENDCLPLANRRVGTKRAFFMSSQQSLLISLVLKIFQFLCLLLPIIGIDEVKWWMVGDVMSTFSKVRPRHLPSSKLPALCAVLCAVSVFYWREILSNLHCIPSVCCCFPAHLQAGTLVNCSNSGPCLWDYPEFILSLSYVL